VQLPTFDTVSIPMSALLVEWSCGMALTD